MNTQHRIKDGCPTWPGSQDRAARTSLLKIRIAGCALVALLGSGIAAPGQTARGGLTEVPARPSIGLEWITQALQSAKLPLGGAELKLLVQMTATSPEPRLEVRSVEPWGERRARVRVACVDHAECLPFYVAVQWQTAEAAAVALATTNASVPSTKSMTAASHAPVPFKASAAGPFAAEAKVNHQPDREVPPSSVSATKLAPQSPEEAVTLRAGSHVTLLMEGDRLHIKVPVVCLESGAAGHTIRVAALDHKQTYLAEIVDATLLKARL